MIIKVTTTKFRFISDTPDTFDDKLLRAERVKDA